MAEEFSDFTVWEAFIRSKGQCECLSPYCSVGHMGRCRERFKYEERVTSDHANGYQAHHVVEFQNGGKGTLDNCQILCIPCHKAQTPVSSMISQFLGSKR
jgi:hypothetical protein